MTPFREARRRLWRVFVRNAEVRPAGTVLAIVGAALIVFSMVLYAMNEKPEVLGFTVLGIAAVTIGAALHRMEGAELGAGSAKLRFGPGDPPTLGLAETDAAVGLEQLDEPSELVVASRFHLAGEALSAVLRPKPDGPLERCHLRLYLYDQDVDRLRPIALPDETEGAESMEEWAPGCGATGTAWDRGEYVLAVGAEVWDTTYGLTTEQSERFRHLSAVASIPVANAASEVIGVITATTSEPDGGALVDEDTFIDLLGRSLLVARVLVDLLGWFDDGYDDPDAQQRP